MWTFLTTSDVSSFSHFEVNRPQKASVEMNHNLFVNGRPHILRVHPNVVPAKCYLYLNSTLATPLKVQTSNITTSTYRYLCVHLDL